MQSDRNDEPTRRDALKTWTGGTLGGLLASAAPGEAAEAQPSRRNVYEQLGVRRVINAAGTLTALGGSLMPPEVVAAWREAAEDFVEIAELQDRIGERLAALLGVEAALVTTGAAGNPPVALGRVRGTGDRRLLVSVFLLKPGHDRVVADRLKEVLQAASM
jgi:L-seryl-tRNA(Ser) seleniumtransferase